MSRLKRIVDEILAQSSGVQAKLNLARVGLKAGINLSRINESTPDNPDLEKKILYSARLVMGRDISIED